MALVKISFCCIWLGLQSCQSVDDPIKLKTHSRLPVEIIRNWNSSQPSPAQEEKTYERQSRGVSNDPETPLSECKPPDGASLTNTDLRIYPKNYITYSISATSRTISEDDLRRAMQEATGAWSSFTPLVFANVSDDADITVEFGRVDECHYNYSISACTVDHKSVRFNDSIDWYVGPRSQPSRGPGKPQNLVCIATHEIGHALGLNHSCNEDAIMYPIVGLRKRCDVIEEDQKGIQKLYGNPWANNRYFYNEEMASFMTTKTCDDCPDVQIGELGDAEQWQVFAVASQGIVQIRPSTDTNRCLQASGDGRVSLEKCAMDEKAQRWHRDAHIDMYDTIFTNIDTDQVLYAGCDNSAVCTKAWHDIPDRDRKYKRWKLSAKKESFEQAKEEEGEQ